MNEVDYVLDLTGAEVEEKLNKVDDLETATGIKEFSPDILYYKNQMALKNGKCYLCLADTFQGEWISTSWEETDINEEFRKIKGITSNTETLIISVRVNRGSGVVVGQEIDIVFSATSTTPSTTKTVGEDGKISMIIPRGDVYQIRPKELSGYSVVNSPVYTANLEQRLVDVVYEQIGTGIYVLADNATNPVDIALWDTANNSHAFWLKLTVSGHDIVFPKSLIPVMSKVFCPEYKLFNSVYTTTTAGMAETNFSGSLNTENWYTEATTEDPGTHKTYVDLYNEGLPEGSTPVTIDGYLPAVMYCRSQTVTYRGATYRGYLPSMGELRALCDNRVALGEALSKIGGGSFPSIQSGHWWSSTQLSNLSCWSLYDGSTSLNAKRIGAQVFCLFDLQSPVL